MLTKTIVSNEVVTVNGTKRKKGNYIVEEGEMIKVFPNAIGSVPFIFDKEDKSILEQYTVCINKDGYAVANDKIKGEKIYLHRVVMDMLDKPSMDYIDHIDGDKKNNRKSNLRICHSDDATNQKNAHYIFPSGEKVQRYRTPNDTFCLEYTDGVMPYIRFEYYNYADLIEHYKSLFYNGFENTTKLELNRYKQVLMEKESFVKSKVEKKQLKKEIIEVDLLIQEVKFTYDYARLMKLKNSFKSGWFIENQKLRIVADIDKTPKEVTESGIIPSIIYFGNHHDKELAGIHSKKPNGKVIY